MTVQHCDVAHRDDRGTISDVLKNCPVDNATLIVTKKGHVRGHHYHLQATVFVFILTGTFQVFSRSDGRVQSADVVPGDLVTFLPNDLHTLRAMEDGSFLLLANGPRGGDLTVHEVLQEAAQ